MGFEISPRLDMTPKLTNIFLRRPSHINEISYNSGCNWKLQNEQERRSERTVVVDALALTTPIISLGGFEGAGCGTEAMERVRLSDSASGTFSCSSIGFDLDLLIHHSMPIVHSLS